MGTLLKTFITSFTLLLFILLSPIQAYENSMLNLKVPSHLRAGHEMQFLIHHRFMGNLNAGGDNFFGTDSGANIGIGLRYGLLENTEIYFNHLSQNGENQWGTGYSFDLFTLDTQLAVHWFSFKNPINRENNYLTQLNMQTKPLFDRLSFTVNFAHDGFLLSPGWGVGFNFKLSPEANLLYEYFPASDPKNLNLKPSFAAGFKWVTYGHHFIFIFTNNNNVGIRQLIQGTSTPNELFFGFNILRLLAW